MDSPENKPARRRRPIRWLLRQVEHGLALIGLAAIVYFGCFDLSRIVSGSMAPTLQGEKWETGDLVLTERVSYWFRQPRRWEVVAFRANDGQQVMKRVIGLPGESVQMFRGGRIFIDDEELERPAELESLKYLDFGNLTGGKAVPCGDGYYVLGDDSRDSNDSRFEGPVQPAQLTGRAWLILAPSSRRGSVK
jgi:signal peptidase I